MIAMLILLPKGSSTSETSPVNNSSVLRSQYLGALAADEYGGDENLRLGFEIHGLIEHQGDVDVYSFEATAGTEVWFDVDRTSATLDSVLEFVDAEGNVLASSNDSSGGVAPFSILPEGHVHPLSKSAFEIHDHWTTNPKDAGFRIVLPGTPGQRDQYYIQVSSHESASYGNYQLQVRLREVDEVPGSLVRHSSIKYSSAGITVNGGPAHSLLAGEAVEWSAANGTVPDAQLVGNLLSSDRATFSIGGRIEDAADVDFYAMDIAYESVQSQGTGVAAVFDVDYADGLAALIQLSVSSIPQVI